jgi:hypothetical protein
MSQTLKTQVVLPKSAGSLTGAERAATEVAVPGSPDATAVAGALSVAGAISGSPGAGGTVLGREAARGVNSPEPDRPPGSATVHPGRAAARTGSAMTPATATVHTA